MSRKYKFADTQKLRDLIPRHRYPAPPKLCCISAPDGVYTYPIAPLQSSKEVPAKQDFGTIY